MVIAMTYDNGNVGAHFGHSEFFQLYELEDGKVIDQAVVQPYSQGHEAMVDFLMEYNTDVLICGGIGEGAINGLTACEVTVFSGVKGPVEEALGKFLSGKLHPVKVANCNDHGSCGDGCGDGCGSGCGGCCH